MNTWIDLPTEASVGKPLQYSCRKEPLQTISKRLDHPSKAPEGPSGDQLEKKKDPGKRDSEVKEPTQTIAPRKVRGEKPSSGKP